jgi:hypothetical protein
MTTKSYQDQNTLGAMTQYLRFNRGMVFGVIIITALLAFELFNYSTTDFALSDLLGDLTFLGVRWATILSIAFCCIDFAGIARLFTPEGGTDPHKEVWYLFGAWMLAATMNAMLTWWGVSIAILNHNTLGSAVVERTTLLRIVPIFVAVLVWIIRVLIIGTFSVAGDRLFSSKQTAKTPYRKARSNSYQSQRSTNKPTANNRRLPATRSARAPRSFSVQGKQANPSKGLFRSGSNYADQQDGAYIDAQEPTTPPEPEYVGVDHPYQSTVVTAKAPTRSRPAVFQGSTKHPKSGYQG